MNVNTDIELSPIEIKLIGGRLGGPGDMMRHNNHLAHQRRLADQKEAARQAEPENVYLLSKRKTNTYLVNNVIALIDGKQLAPLPKILTDKGPAILDKYVRDYQQENDSNSKLVGAFQNLVMARMVRNNREPPSNVDASVKEVLKQFISDLNDALQPKPKQVPESEPQLFTANDVQDAVIDSHVNQDKKDAVEKHIRKTHGLIPPHETLKLKYEKHFKEVQNLIYAGEYSIWKKNILIKGGRHQLLIRTFEGLCGRSKDDYPCAIIVTLLQNEKKAIKQMKKQDTYDIGTGEPINKKERSKQYKALYKWYKQSRLTTKRKMALYKLIR
jgi:hypothetical protein